MVNFQSVEFRVAPNAGTHQVDIIATPAPVNFAIENHIAFAAGTVQRPPPPASISKWPRSNGIVWFSAALCPRNAPNAVLRGCCSSLPTMRSARSSSCGASRAVSSTGKLRIEPAAADARLFVNFDSLTLGEIVRLTNKFSSNLMARHMLLTLGEERYGAPATLEKGSPSPR